jgi:hypothetical protein
LNDSCYHDERGRAASRAAVDADGGVHVAAVSVAFAAAQESAAGERKGTLARCGAVSDSR